MAAPTQKPTPQPEPPAAVAAKPEIPVEPTISIVEVAPAPHAFDVQTEEFNPSPEDVLRAIQNGGRDPRLIEPAQRSRFVPQSISMQTEAEMAAGRKALQRRNRVFVE